MKKYSVLIILLYLIGCESPTPPHVLAKVGSSFVTDSEFKDKYKNILIQSQTQDSPFERNRTLQSLVRTKLFSEYARESQLTLDSLTHRKIISVKNQILREALYENQIETKTHFLSDSIARQHFLWMNSECNLKHLFSPHKSVLDSMYLQLQQPALFQQFAHSLFSDSTLKNNGGLLGWIKYNDLDPSLEKVAFTMKVGTMSQPTRSQHGWHILFKKDERKQMIISEDEYAMRRNSILSSIHKKETLISANHYVHNLLDSKHISIDDSLVYHSIGQIFTLIQLQQGQVDAGAKTQYGDILMSISQSLLSSLNEPLAHYDGGTFTVQDFMDGLLSLPPVQSTHSPITSFYQALRNKLLVEEAKGLGLENNGIVQLKVKDIEDQFFASAFLKTQLKEPSNGHFSSSELKSISDSLRSIYTITLFPEHLNALFIQPN